VVEAEAKSSRWKDIAYAANWLIWLVFAAELTFMLVVAPRKAAALRAHSLDAVIVVVTTPIFGAFYRRCGWYGWHGCCASCDLGRS